MMKNLIILTTFLTTTAFSQIVNLDGCNKSETIASRSNCLKNSVESLLYNEFVSVLDSLKMGIGAVKNVKMAVFVDQIGNLYIKDLQTEDSVLKNATIRVIRSIKPLQSYKNHLGEMLYDEFTIDMNFSNPEKSTGSNSFSENKIEEKSNDNTQKEPEDQLFAVIEQVPKYPGCFQETNLELKKCMSDNIKTVVHKNFNTTLANSLRLNGLQRITVMFKINKEGYVTGIRARAPHPILEKEAIRVVKLLPKMIPGKQKGKEVGVIYSLPIIFQVIDDRKEKKRKRKKRRNKNN